MVVDVWSPVMCLPQSIWKRVCLVIWMVGACGVVACNNTYTYLITSVKRKDKEETEPEHVCVCASTEHEKELSEFAEADTFHHFGWSP